MAMTPALPEVIAGGERCDQGLGGRLEGRRRWDRRDDGLPGSGITIQEGDLWIVTVDRHHPVVEPEVRIIRCRHDQHAREAGPVGRPLHRRGATLHQRIETTFVGAVRIDDPGPSRAWAVREVLRRFDVTVEGDPLPIG